MDDRKSARREAENRRRAQKGLPPVGKWGGRRNGSGRRSAASQPHPETDDGAGAAPFGLSRAQFARAMQEMVDRLAPAAAANPIRPALTIARHPPAAMPPAGMEMAADSALTGNFDWAATEWVNSLGGGLTVDSVSFPGFATLAEYAQRPEFRVISETIAGDMTRKWIDFNVTGDETERQDAKRRAELDPVGEAERAADLDARRKRIAGAGKLDRVKVIKDEMDRLGVRDHFYALARDDGFFGRSHLFLDFGYGMDSDELAVPIGNGRDAFSRSKVAKNSLRGLRTIEAVWVYPQAFNAVNPFDVSWYTPQSWYVQGRHVSGSRLLTFVGRPVPDFIKPAYSFGGLSLSQLVKPYVDNWLKTRTAVASIIHSFSVMVLMTDLQSILADSGSALMGRVALFNMLRDNQGCFVVNKNSEDFKNVSAPLSGLHELQAQAQEHLSSVSRIPLVKLTGIQPAGLNACLPGDTLIFTDRGHIPIRDVALSDRVMTRRGFAPLVFSGVTKFATELIEIRTAADRVLRCTANHPIWLSSINEFVPAENVRCGDRLLLIGERDAIPNTHLQSLGEGNGGGETRTGIISRGTQKPGAWSIFIGRCGKRIADLFQMGSISTIATATPRTINSKILKRCTDMIMPRIMELNWNLAKGGHLVDECVLAQNAERSFSSTNFRVGRNFAVTNAVLPTGGILANLKQNLHRFVFAGFAGWLLGPVAETQCSVRVGAQQRAKIDRGISGHIIERILKNMSGLLTKRQSVESDEIVSVRRIPASEPVYDLSVASGHLPEFFANGILTHNSSEGEIKVYDDSIADYQNRFFRPNLTRVIDFIQLSLFGEVDQEITFDFEPLRELTEKERAEKDKADAERHEKYVNMGAIDAGEIRKVIIEDPTLPYTALDPDDVPEPPSEGEGDLFGPDDDDGGGGSGGASAGEGFNKDKGKQVPVQTGDMALDEILEKLRGGDMIRLPTLLTVPGDSRAEPRMVVLSLDRLDPKTNTLHATLEAMGLDDATWRESDHRRDKDGKFSTTGGGSGGGGDPQKKTEPNPQKTESKTGPNPEPKKAALPSGEMPDIPDFLRRGPKAELAPAVAGKEGGGEKRGTGGAASKLYKPTTENADSIVAKVPGAREAIADVMARMSEGVPTDSLPSEGGFKNEDGSYTPEREAIHREILSRIFTPEALARAKPAEGEKPTLTILGGRGGSGKSWITQEHGPVDPTKSILLDSDWVKGQLPEYQGWNANLVHEESSDIVMEADRIARAAGVNVIHDATLRSDTSVAKRVAQFEAAGYELEGYYMHCPPEIAAQRALSRFKTRKGDFSGRFVPPEVVLGNVNNEANFDKLSTGMKRWAIYDNSTAEGPQLVSKSWKD